MPNMSPRQQEIQKSLELLRLVNQTTDDYLFIIDFDTPRVYFTNEKIAEKYNLPGTCADGAPMDLWQQIVYSRDFPAVAQDLARVFSGEKREHNLVYRLVDRNGKRVWINCRGTLHHDADGQPLMFVGRVSDTALGQKTDPLTGLLNEHKYMEDLNAALVAESHGAMVIFGLDDFKNINIRYGRQYGDDLLKNVAKALEKVVPPHFLLYRLDGDRFALNLTGYTREEVRQLYQQLCQNLSLNCTISAGAVLYGDERLNAQALFQYAESSLDRAKFLGKNMLVFFAPDFYEESHSGIDLLMEMRQSVQQGCKDFFLCYQPQVDTASGRIVGAEALLRYESPRRGQIGPDDFIPLLEKSGLIIPVGEWVLREALAQCRIWREHLPGLRMSVNISHVQYRQEAFPDRVREIFRQSGLPAGALTLEVTEGTQLQDYQHFNRIFRSWAKDGIDVAIDDFGTGYSSLSYLKSIDIDEVKIDRCFVRGIQHSAYNYQLLKNIIQLTQDIDIRVCCEGVETEAELEVLQELSPNILQGFLFARPCTVERFEEMYIRADSPEYQSRERAEERCRCMGEHARQQFLRRSRSGDLSAITENIEEMVYVVDPESHEIYYMNAACRQLTGMYDYKGKKCYEAVCGHSQPCETCIPNDQLNADSFTLLETFNPHLGRHLLTKSKFIPWQQGTARLGVAIDVTKKELLSQDVQKKLDFEKSIVSYSRMLAEEIDMAHALQETMRFIGEFYQADRTYIFEPNADMTLWDNSFEWCAEDVTSEKDNLQAVPGALFPRWIDAFLRDESVFIEDSAVVKDISPTEWELLVAQNIHCLVAIPIMRGGKLIGFIGVDNPRRYRNDDGHLRTMASFLAERLSHNATETRLHELLDCDYEDILKRVQLGLWVIVLHKDTSQNEMFADSTMRELICADENATPVEMYQSWYSRINPEYLHYVDSSVLNMVQSNHITQLEYLWNHPEKGDIAIRCVGGRVQDRNGCICLEGYHRAISDIDRPQSLPEQPDWMKLEFQPDSQQARVVFGQELLDGGAEIIENFPQCWIDSQRVHPDHAHAFADFFVGEGAQNDCSGYDLLLKGRSDSYEWFRLRTVHFREGSEGIKVQLESLNQMRKWELEYNRQSDFYRAILNETIAHAEFDLDLGVTLTASGLWAYLADESRLHNDPMFAATQRLMDQSIAPEDLEWARRFFSIESFHALPRENNYTEKHDYRRLVNGEIRWVQVSVHVFKERFTGKSYGLMCLRDIDAQKRRELALKSAASLDPLTQVFNGKSFEQEVCQYMQQSSQHCGALLLFDMDNFKAINDNYGHLEGDDALQRMVRALRGAFPDASFLGRMGGDEFLVFVPQCTGRTALEGMLEQLFLRLYADKGVPISCSAGVAIARAPFSYEISLSQADHALYHSKEQGKNRASFYGEE